MSAPTMLELHDTQMSDYPSDIDVPMHSSSSEYWFHTEVTMEDDGHHLHMPKISHPEHESTIVEVDMEPYDGEREYIDYEKADETGTYTQEGGDLEDVDLYDASRVHTPTTVFQNDATSTPPIDVTDDTHMSSLLANTPTSAGTTIGDMNEMAHTAYEGGPGNGISSLETPATLLPPLNTHLGDGFAYVEGSELSSHSDRQTVEGDGFSAVLQSVELAGLPVNLHTETAPDVALDVHADDQVDRQAETSLHFEEHIEVPVPAQSPQSVKSVDHVDHRQRAECPSELAEEQRGDSADPHEISEGVYIDPPPAVLLSLPSDQPDVCLFNHPQPSSGSTTPSPEEAENTEQPLTVLLRHQPTLYYEPLASVFDALRQEEYISRIPGIADGELVLDAYDLHLTLSEDNLYAREVTLHDLNVIHDGTDMSGPLRLQLQSVVPRFILRYHSLRDQISRLNLATEGGADHTGLVGEEGHREDTSAQETPKHTQEHIQNAESNDRRERQPLELSEVQDIYHQETTESLESSGEDIGDTSNFNIEVREAEGEAIDPLGNHEAESEDARPLEDELEYADGDDGARFDPEDVSEDVDADATRNIAETHVLAPVSAEYTEYEEYAESQDEYNGTHGEAHSEDPDGQQALGRTEFEEYKEPTTVDESTAVEYSAAAKLRETGIVNDKSQTKDSRQVANFDPQSETFDVSDRNSQATDLELQNVVAESDSHSVAVLEKEHSIADPLLDYKHSEQNVQQDINPEPFDEEWDDSLDGEGEPDIFWEEEHDDIVSNESSITLSSTTSKRRHEEVDSEAECGLLPDSPGLKRPRVE